jgi:hypothetical protein
MGARYSTCCRNHMSITHISAGTGFWTYIDWDLSDCRREYYTPLKPILLFFNTLYMAILTNYLD